MFTATYKRFVSIYYYIIILLYQVCSIQLYGSYPLPSLTFTESDASPLLDIEENSTASAMASNMMMPMPSTSDVVDSSSTTSTTTIATNTQQSV